MFAFIWSYIRSIKVLLLFLVVVFGYVGVLLRLEMSQNDYYEPFPKIEHLNERSQRLAHHVEAGLHVKTFPSFSVKDAVFIVDATVWFRFSSSLISLDTLSQFTVQNSQELEPAMKMYQSKPRISLQGDRVLVAYDVQVKFKNSFRYHQFPLENHRIHILLCNTIAAPQELCFVTQDSNFTMSDDVMVDDWSMQARYAQAGYIGSSAQSDILADSCDYPAVLFSVDVKRQGYNSFGSLYFPLFVLFIIGLLSLLMSITDVNRLVIIATSLPMLVLYRLVIDTVSPVTSSITHIDFVYYLLVMLSFPILLFEVFVVFEGQRIAAFEEGLEKRKKTSRLESINRLVYLAILIIFAIGMTFSVMV